MEKPPTALDTNLPSPLEKNTCAAMRSFKLTPICAMASFWLIPASMKPFSSSAFFGDSRAMNSSRFIRYLPERSSPATL